MFLNRSFSNEETVCGARSGIRGAGSFLMSSAVFSSIVGALGTAGGAALRVELTDRFELFLLKLEKKPLLAIDGAFSLMTSEISLGKVVLTGDFNETTDWSSDSWYEPDKLIFDNSRRTEPGRGDCGDIGGELGATRKLEEDVLFVRSDCGSTCSLVDAFLVPLTPFSCFDGVAGRE